MEGRINSNREFVWINLPEDQRHYVQDIGQFLPPTQGWFDRAMSGIGLAETPPHWANLGSWGLNKDHPKMTNMIQSLPMIVMSSKKEFFVTKDGTLLHLCSTNIDDAVGHIIAADMARNGRDTNEVDLLRTASATREDSIIGLHERYRRFRAQVA
jgi:hypothetical protein